FPVGPQGVSKASPRSTTRTPGWSRSSGKRTPQPALPEIRANGVSGMGLPMVRLPFRVAANRRAGFLTRPERGARMPGQGERRLAALGGEGAEHDKVEHGQADAG